MNRKKRLEKGIESLREQIEIHRIKKEQAKQEGNIERVGYYEKEIEVFEETKKKKEEQLEKS
ncbi:MAG: hypothetical protein AABW81_02705 [Nanoarchaeota archaeon]|mgnify:CR=1 FL=1